MNTDEITLYGFADILSASFRSFDTADEMAAVKSQEDCLSNIKSWMDSNRMQMNDGKNEFLFIGSRQQLGLCDTEGIPVNGINIFGAAHIKYLGVHIVLMRGSVLNITSQLNLELLHSSYIGYVSSGST